MKLHLTRTIHLSLFCILLLLSACAAPVATPQTQAEPTATTVAETPTATPPPVATAAPVEEAATIDPAAIAERFAATISSGDLDGWLALFTLDAEFADFSYHAGTGHDALRQWGQAIVNAEGGFTIVESRIAGEQVVWIHEYKDRGFSNQGQATVTMDGKLIAKLVIGAPDAPSAAAPTANVDPTAVVNQFVEAVNSGDKEATAALFSTDACVGYSGNCFDADKLASWWDSDIFNVEGQIEVADLTVDGDTVTLTGQFNSTGWSGNANYVFTVVDGKITGWDLR